VVKAIRTAALIVLPSLLVFGQEFEVASIKPSPPSALGKASAGLHIDGAMVRYSSLSLTLYLGMAYSLKSYQISAPDWMASGRWDITAKLPDGSDPKQIPDMLQALLRDQFQMKMHRETKEFPVYGLIVGKGELKLKESAADAPSDGVEPPKRTASVAVSGSNAGTTVTYGNGSYFTIGDDSSSARSCRWRSSRMPWRGLPIGQWWT
jgi:uncharacterized protein (TIGR03435 family)